eukprot:7993752-Pyramimonas_sp.AAC.1
MGGVLLRLRGRRLPWRRRRRAASGTAPARGSEVGASPRARQWPHPAPPTPPPARPAHRSPLP